MECNEKLNIHQINKLDINDLKRKDIFPITVTSAVFDKQGNSLEALLACNNFLFLPFKGSAEATRLTVSILLRRKGLIISYINYNNEIVIEQYIGDSKADEVWSNNSNWKAPFSGDIQSIVNESINKRFSSSTRFIPTIDSIGESDVIYRIVETIDLRGETLTLPTNVTLDFQGGSFSNGTIVGSNTKVLTVGNPFNDTIIVLGTIYDINGINILAITKGTTDQRPVDTIISEGFQYYDSTLNKMILWNGTAWVNIDGTALA